MAEERSLEIKPDSAGTAVAAAETSRAVAEVQAAILMARRFPREEAAAIERIKRACTRPALAEDALYVYPRAGANIEGPSIRLAEVIAQNWGNMQFGVLELARDEEAGVAEVEAFAWDLETNVRDVRKFQVPLKRKARGRIVAIDDPRDVYEMVANMGARRKRAAILAVIPRDVADEAVRTVKEILAKAEGGKPLAERIAKMAAIFERNFKVTAAMLEKFLGHKLEAASEPEMVKLGGIVRSIRDGMAAATDYFPDLAPKGDGDGGGLNSANTKTPSEIARESSQTSAHDAALYEDRQEGADPIIAERKQSADQSINDAQLKVLTDAVAKAGIPEMDVYDLLKKHSIAELKNTTFAAFPMVLNDVITWRDKAKHKK